MESETIPIYVTKKIKIIGAIVFSCFILLVAEELTVAYMQYNIYKEYNKIVKYTKENNKLMLGLIRELNKNAINLQKLIDRDEKVITRLNKSALFLKRYNPKLEFSKAFEFVKYVYYYTNKDLDELKLILSMIIIESDGNENAISQAGATGLMQIMPAVWKIPRQQLLDPEINIYHGIRILNIYKDRYGLIKGLNAYNGSLGRYTYSDKVFKILSHYNKYIELPINILLKKFPNEPNLIIEILK